jgi:hypothetical protein
MTKAPPRIVQIMTNFVVTKKTASGLFPWISCNSATTETGLRIERPRKRRSRTIGLARAAKIACRARVPVTAYQAGNDLEHAGNRLDWPRGTLDRQAAVGGFAHRFDAAAFAAGVMAWGFGGVRCVTELRWPLGIGCLHADRDAERLVARELNSYLH